MNAINWRGQLTDAAAMLARYRVTIEHGPAQGWHVVEVRETRGRPELRNIVLGTTEPVAFDWLNVGAFGLKSEMKRDLATGKDENTLNLGVSTSSYYIPSSGVSGPNHVKVSGDSDTVHGWGMAIGLPDQPTKEEDNRYMTLIVVWQRGNVPPPVPPVVPPPPAPGVGISRADVIQMQSYFNQLKSLADSGAQLAQRILEGIP